MYHKGEKFTKYNYWLRFKFHNTARKNFPMFFQKATGMQLPTEWRDPPLNCPTKGYIRTMVDLGYEPEGYSPEYVNIGIALPLLVDRKTIGAFLVAYRPRRGYDYLKWVKYTNHELVSPETPLVAFSGPIRSKPNGYIVDSLKDYFKLINWIYCQAKTYALMQNKPLPMVMYVDQGDENFIEMLRKNQMHFRVLTDFTGRFTEDIREGISRERKGLHADVFQSFTENPIPGCYSRLQFEDAVQLLNQKFTSP